MIMNLSVNARDAMPNGGKLIIETANATLDEAFCNGPKGTGFEPGNYVVLSVSDTGHGIDKKELEHIYEPFYTTKDVGKGTGLGLSIVYGIVNSHNGHIICDSKVGEGTTFHIYLPAIDHQIRPDPIAEKNDQISGSETILLVDDDEAVRNLGHEMLSKIGHRVLTAPDGESALALYQARQNEIDLIMLDLMMPGMGGYRCLEHLIEINPEAKILVASGYSCKESMKHQIQSKAKGFLSKPYAIQQVSEAIRNIFDVNMISHP
jgi:CheY-like chemotaxis protein